MSEHTGIKSISTESGEDRVVVAKIGKTHGIKGALKLHTFTEDPDAVLHFQQWFLRFPGKPWQPLADFKITPHGDGFLIAFPDAMDCNLAQHYVNAELAVPRHCLPELEPGEGYYWVDLINLKVVNSRGDHFGVVTDLLETGANEVLVVRAERERLIPCIASVIIAVDRKQGIMTVDWELDWS